MFYQNNHHLKSATAFLLAVCTLLSIQEARATEAVSCSERTNCSYCILGSKTKYYFWTNHCRWCPQTTKCYDPDDSSNPCEAEKDIEVVAGCPHEKRMPYDKNLALKALHLAGSAYADGECLAKCIEEFDPKYRLLKELRFPCKNVRTDLIMSQYECFAHVSVSDEDKHVIVSYRGTNDPPQLLSEGGECMFKKGVKAPTGGTAYEYFYRGVHLSYGGIVEEVKPLVQRGYSLWVVGHSLGGAFATVFTSFLGQENWVNKAETLLLTFGSPRVGDWDFARNLEFHFPNIYRIVHQRDLVVHIPPQTTNWQRVLAVGAYIFAKLKWEIEVTINWNNPYHVGKLILYNNDMSNLDDYIECEHENVNECTNLMLLNIDDHLNYFQKTVSDVCGCNQRKETSSNQKGGEVSKPSKEL